MVLTTLFAPLKLKETTPQKKRLIDDIRRNLEYFKHTDITGKSDLRIAFNCAFESFSSDSKIKKRFYITTIDGDKKNKNNRTKI